MPEKPIKILTLEEEIRAGGFGMMLFDSLRDRDKVKNKDIEIMALENTFADVYAENIYATFGLDCDSIVKKILNSKEI